MKALSGTGRLLRLALRLDRFKLPIWIGANVGLVAVTLPQLASAYGSQQQMVAYASATAPSAVTRLLGGALTGPSLGEISIVETYFLIILLLVLMNIFLVARHTRLNEENGRSELMGSMLVGRQASLTASLLLAILANTVTAGLIFLVFVGNSFPVAGSAAYSVAIGLTGLLFAGITAITVQLYENTRTASGLAGLVFGVSFMIRGLGDAFGQLLPSGLGVKTNMLSWFSPLGWAPNMRPFAGELWWVLSLFAVAILFTVAVAYLLLARRDVGSGLLAARPGKAQASPQLLQRFGLMWRLNRVSFMAWVSSFAVMGIVMGAVAEEFKDLIAGNEEMQKLLEAIGGGNSDPATIMFNTILVMGGIAAAGYGLQTLTRMRSEEASGRLELLLSTKLGRWQWLATTLTYTLITCLVALLALGLGAGLAYGIASGQLLKQVAELSVAAVIHLPAVSVLLGVSLIIFSVLPRSFVSLSWGLWALCLGLFQLGSLLNLPQWLINLSPFAHTPPALGGSIALVPLGLQLLVSSFAIGAAFLLFRRRDLSTDA